MLRREILLSLSLWEYMPNICIHEVNTMIALTSLVNSRYLGWYSILRKKDLYPVEINSLHCYLFTDVHWMVVQDERHLQAALLTRPNFPTLYLKVASLIRCSANVSVNFLMSLAVFSESSDVTYSVVFLPLHHFKIRITFFPHMEK